MPGCKNMLSPDREMVISSPQDPGASGSSELIRSCSYCGRFFARCCQHIHVESERICHHFPVVYTDGACRNNGRRGAVQVAGLGIALGSDEGDQWAVHVDDSVDPGAQRTSQRAELLAAIKGVELFTERWLTHEEDDHANNPDDIVDLIIATDSEYVCKGMYEWYPTWKTNGWRAANGAPKNLDLFHKLNDAVQRLETLGVDVGFLHLQRENNPLADALAKSATA
ncbi:ribonuclease H-like protein [Auricularia subglabra TFB-10046 SS5]|nr:ribonuclease H-like protein [Auricularia subglabra TFB-10046 SS5]